MSYEQYWDMDSELTRAYRKADEIRQERANTDAWLQGAYFYEAFARVAPLLAFTKHPKAEPYLEKPYELRHRELRTKQEDKKKLVENSRDMFVAHFVTRINQNFAKKGGAKNAG